ncbi:acyl-CoA synthetase (AMP-forming)/AMP-acid ligase II [Paenibacillus phyllosphaerae]|uniref:Acyl-CoA synthetase (AMP-forming)/AMP-acid ligase II n=1 Tax=Paenibacillus phyllosphaerae TaxID=274593 RepID=A0A7W5FP12_9BACL|nr:hypothetical protein [Paenibacillus phyllosphaerae]MBB3111865.1 acyl-CoA synthetase (AMP-forming)/AMP-acid ligase II [Paenibacillus phyllosphaerae]
MTIKKLYLTVVLYFIWIALSCTVVAGTPHLFVRILNLICIVLLSAMMGAFIREIFMLKQKQKEKEQS